MVQNKKIGVGLVLIVGLLGMGVSGAALALPELQVDSRLVQDGSTVDKQALSDDSAESVIADDDTQSTAN